MRHPANVNSEDDRALLLAANSGHLHIVKYLVTAGAHLSHPKTINDYSLISAAKNGNLDVIEYLRHTHNINPDRALLSAAINCHIEVVKYLANCII